MDDIRDIADCLYTHICHGYPIPSTVSPDLVQRVDNELTYMWYSQYSYPSIQMFARVGMGFLIKEIWQVKNVTLTFNTFTLRVKERGFNI